MKRSVRLILLNSLSVAATIACSDQPTRFVSTSSKLATKPVAAQTEAQEGDGSASKPTPPISKLLVHDTFLMPEMVDHEQLVEVPLEPKRQQSCEQSLGSQTCVSQTISGATDRNVTLTRAPHTKVQVPHTLTHVGKRIDVFSVLNDQFSFAGYPITTAGVTKFPARDRMKAGMARLISNLSDTNWRIFMSGLGDGSSTLADIQLISKTSNGNLPALMDAVFVQPSMGDSRIFNTLNLLADKKKAEDDDFAVHLYTVMTDSRNCRDNNQANSSVCGAPILANRWDHFRYVLDYHLHLASDMKYMSLFGAWYRQTTGNNAACAPTEQLETGESQFAQLAKAWNETLVGFPVTPWTADMCGNNDDLVWIDNLSAGAKKLAAYRVRLPSVPGVFVDPAYNLMVTQDGALVAADKYQFIVGTQAVLKFAEALTGTVDITYHLASSSYDKVSFENIFSGGAPQSETVVASWNYGGVTGSLPCYLAASFADIDPSAKCRHSGTSLYLKSSDAIPLPGSAIGNQSISVSYRLPAATLKAFSKTASSAIVALEEATFSGTTSNGAALPVPADVSAVGNNITFTFADIVPPGTYQVCFYENSRIIKSCELSSFASASQPGLSCVAAGSPMDCTLTTDRKKINYTAVIPKDPLSNKRIFEVNYNSSLDPISSLTLEAPPLASSLAVRLEDLSGNLIRQLLNVFEYRVNGTSLQFTPAIQPGQRAKVAYRYSPVISANCFTLSSKVAEATTIEVSYGAAGAEQALTSKDYTVEADAQKDIKKICLPVNQIKPGQRLIVSYSSSM